MKATINGESIIIATLGLVEIGGIHHYAIVDFFGRRSTMEYVIPHINKGAHLSVGDKKILYQSLGEGRYVVKKGVLGDGTPRALIIPGQITRQDREEDGAPENDDASAVAQINQQKEMEKALRFLFYRGERDLDDALWRAVTSRSAVPVLLEWKNPVMGMLRDLDTLEALRSDANLPQNRQHRIVPVRFVENQGGFNGVVSTVTDDDMACVVGHLLRTRKIAA